MWLTASAGWEPIWRYGFVTLGSSIPSLDRATGRTSGDVVIVMPAEDDDEDERERQSPSRTGRNTGTCTWEETRVISELMCWRLRKLTESHSYASRNWRRGHRHNQQYAYVFRNPNVYCTCIRPLAYLQVGSRSPFISRCIPYQIELRGLISQIEISMMPIILFYEGGSHTKFESRLASKPKFLVLNCWTVWKLDKTAIVL